MQETVIEGDDSMEDALMKLSEGNPGAITALTEMVKVASNEDVGDDEVQLEGAAAGFQLLLKVDMEGLRGPDIWELYKDECDEDAGKMVEKVRSM